MSAPSEVTRYPAILIGLGGTGVRALRYVRWLAEKGDDPGLSAMLERGDLRLVAIDTDFKSNEVKDIDDYVQPRPRGWRVEGDAAHRRLPQLDALIQVKTEDIVRAFDVARQASRRRLWVAASEGETLEAQAGDALTPAVPRAFMALPRDVLEEMTLGQAREGGAGQWRMLGRIALFTQVHAIYSAVEKAYKSVRDGGRAGNRVRAHIICSLAGGTGSGMFWDVAFLLRIIDPSCFITGNFLLAEAFRGVDTAGRVEPNTYAALKEISIYKNWRLGPNEQLPVIYPVGERGLSYKGERGSASTLDLAYIYQSFATTGDSAAAGNIDDSKVQLSCLRLAENVTAQLRRDTQMEGLENNRSDVGTRASQHERGFAFSTSAFVPLGFAGTQPMARTLLTALVRGMQESVYEKRPQLSLGQMVDFLRGCRPDSPAMDGPSPDCLGGVDGGKPPAEDVVTLWCRWHQEHPPESSHLVTGMLAHLNTLEREAPQLAQRGLKAAERSARVRTLYADHIDPRLREGWAKAIRAPDWTNGKPVSSSDLTDADLLEANLQEDWTRLGGRLRALAGYLQTSLIELESAAQDWLKRAVRTLDAKAARAKPVPRPIAIAAPASLVQMRSALGLWAEGSRDAELQRFHDIYGCGPLDRIMVTLAKRLRPILETHGKPKIDANRLSEIIDVHVAKFSQKMAGDLESVLNAHRQVQDIRLRRSRAIIAFGHSRVGSVYDTFDAAAEDFETLIGPFGTVLGRLRAVREDDPLVRTAEGILRTVEIVANQHKVDDELLNRLKADGEKIGRWRDTLEALSDAVSEQARTPKTAARKPLVRLVAEMLERDWLSSDDSRDIVRDEKALGLRMKLAEILAFGFAAFWSEQPEFVLESLGGETQLRKLIEKCRSTVFGSGSVRPTIQRARLLIGLPAMENAINPEGANRTIARLKERFSLAAQSVLTIQPEFTRATTPLPFIYYEELYRAGSEILEVARYQRSYMSYDERLRKLFHFTPEAAGYDNLIPDDAAVGTVFCGNSGCTRNIANVDRQVLLCPGCSQPVRNRCGNADCMADDLTEKIRTFKLGIWPEPLKCPECRGELRTYWWRCPDVAHHHRWSSTAVHECPQCRDEYQKGSRSFDQIQIVYPTAEIECPGCQTLQLPAEERVRIPHTLRDSFTNGVPPMARPQFERLIGRHDLEASYCKNSVHKEHFIFPSLVVVENERVRRYNLFRENHEFISDNRTHATSFSCFHCGYPLHTEAVERLDAGQPLSCPRCLRNLKQCHFCSHRGQKLVSMVEAASAEFCPRCTNRAVLLPGGFSIAVSGVADSAGFCRNLFNCPAAAHPWSTVADFNREQCGACGEGKLLPFKDLHRHVERCPVCLSLIGLPNGSRVERLSAERLPGHFAQQNADGLGDACKICGTIPAAILRWMIDSQYFMKSSLIPSHDVNIDQLRGALKGSYAMPELTAKDGMDILEAMASEKDHVSTIMSLSADLPSFDIVTVVRQMERMFVGRSISSQVARRKLAQLLVAHDKIKAREQGDVSQIV